MNFRPKRTYSLPNREKLTLPVVQIQESDNGRIELENSFSDRETERSCYSTGIEYENKSKEVYYLDLLQVF